MRTSNSHDQTISVTGDQEDGFGIKKNPLVTNYIELVVPPAVINISIQKDHFIVTLTACSPSHPTHEYGSFASYDNRNMSDKKVEI
jgi:hypothetical protein